MKVFIDPGHGGSDPGAVNESFGITEAFVNLDIAKRLQSILYARGYETMMSRTTDDFVGLRERANMANNWGANYFISVHSNASENPNANGTETLYHRENTTGERLANEIQVQLILQNNLSDRGIIPRPNLAVLRLTNMPAVMAEVAFISNPKEAALLASPEFRQQSAQAIADGFTNFINMNSAQQQV